jgi:Flp pilus assembly protein TadB
MTRPDNRGFPEHPVFGFLAAFIIAAFAIQMIDMDAINPLIVVLAFCLIISFHTAYSNHRQLKRLEKEIHELKKAVSDK